MKRILLLLILLDSFFAVFAQDATVIYKNTVNSTVTIETEDGLGSGFFMGENIIATNYHVIKGDTEAYCYTNNLDTKYKIEGYVAVDTSIDLILLKVSGLKRTPIRISTTPLEIGQKVYVIGSPKGLPATISDGIVSALRDFDGYKLMQITAPISHGSSGGPVLNSKGELIGVSVASLKEGQNLNFAIPKSNVVSLLKNKKNITIPLSSFLPYAISKGNNVAANANPYANYTINDYTNAIEKNPNDASAYYYRAIAKYYSADYKGAMEDCNKAMGLKPNDANIYYYRGKAKYALGDYEGSLQDYHKVLELAPNDAFYNDVYNYIAQDKKELGDSSGAIKYYNKGNEITVSEIYNAASSKYISGDYKGAIEEYSKAIELNPKDAFAYHNRGLVKDASGDHIGASQDYNNAKDLGYK